MSGRNLHLKQLWRLLWASVNKAFQRDCNLSELLFLLLLLCILLGNFQLDFDMNTQQNPYGAVSFWYFTPPSPTFTENGHSFCLWNPVRRNIIPGSSAQIDTNWSWWNVQLSSFPTALLQDDSNFHWQLQAMESSSWSQLYWNSCPRQQVQQPLRRRQTLTGIAELSSPLSPSDSRAIDFNYINGAIAKCLFFLQVVNLSLFIEMWTPIILRFIQLHFLALWLVSCAVFFFFFPHRRVFFSF